MSKLIFSLSLIIGALAVGQTIYIAMKDKSVKKIVLAENILVKVRNVVVYILSPIIMLGAFWVVDISNLSLISLPFICVFSLLLGSALALVYSKIMKLNRLQKGALFCCGASTNLGSIGGLLTFAFLGEAGYAFCILYIVLSAPFLYIFVYPVASSFSDSHIKMSRIKRMLSDKLILTYFSTMIVGFTLNFLDIPRPTFYGELNEYLIPNTYIIIFLSYGAWLYYAFFNDTQLSKRNRFYFGIKIHYNTTFRYWCFIPYWFAELWRRYAI